jgi:hypothetical protein
VNRVVLSCGGSQGTDLDETKRGGRQCDGQVPYVVGR